MVQFFRGLALIAVMPAVTVTVLGIATLTLCGAVHAQDANQRQQQWLDHARHAASAYYDCVERMAAQMALASREPAETIAKGARASCNDKRSSLINLFAVGVSAGDLTDLGETKLIEETDNQASNRAVAATIAARGTKQPEAGQREALEKDQSDKAEAFANCAKAQADAMALASSEPAETVAKAAVASCWKEAQAFVDADARTVGRVASTNSIEQLERLASGPLIARVIAARAAAHH